MLKKLLTLSAAAMVCASMYAAPDNLVEDYYIDWKTSDWNFYVMGYTPVVEDGILTSEKPEDAGWYQYFVADGIPTSSTTTYYVTAKIKASEDVSFNLNMGWGWGEGQQVGQQISATTEWSEVTLIYTGIEGASSNLVAQPGGLTAKIEWEWIKVQHEASEEPESDLVYSIDWYNKGWNFYVMGYEPKVVDGILVSENPMNEDGSPAWYQYFVADGIPTVVGKNYKAVARIKASEDVTFALNMGWGWGEGQILNNQITASTDWTEQEVMFNEIGGTSCNLVAQPGVSTAKIEWDWIKVYKISNTTAIEAIDSDIDAPAVYYNMQGMQIANPEKGQIYIVKKGSKATKTIIR